MASGFTHDEITGCTISKCEGVTINGAHAYYVFGVTDDNNKDYDWKDKWSPSGLSGTSIHNAIYNHLSTGVTKEVVVSEVRMDDPSVIGQAPIQP